MSIVKTLRIESINSDNTEQIGEAIGRRLRGREVFELSSDLGGGKTTFARGLARGAGSSDHVTSPTFTISRQYYADQLTIYHYDFYRLSEAGLMQFELSDAFDDPSGVVVVEWGKVVRGVLPESRVTIHITRTNESERIIEITYPEELDYLLQDYVDTNNTNR